MIGRVSGVASLNGAEVRPRERRDSELRYLQHIAAEVREGGRDWERLGGIGREGLGGIGRDWEGLGGIGREGGREGRREGRTEGEEIGAALRAREREGGGYVPEPNEIGPNRQGIGGERATWTRVCPSTVAQSLSCPNCLACLGCLQMEAAAGDEAQRAAVRALHPRLRHLMATHGAVL